MDICVFLLNSQDVPQPIGRWKEDSASLTDENPPKLETGAPYVVHTYLPDLTAVRRKCLKKK